MAASRCLERRGAAKTTAAPHFFWIKALCHKITDRRGAVTPAESDPFWTRDSRFTDKVKPTNAVKRSENPTEL